MATSYDTFRTQINYERRVADEEFESERGWAGLYRYRNGGGLILFRDLATEEVSEVDWSDSPEELQDLWFQTVTQMGETA